MVSLGVRSFKTVSCEQQFIKMQLGFRQQGAPYQVPRTTRVQARANQVLVRPNRFLVQVQGSNDHRKQDCKGKVAHVPDLGEHSNVLQKSNRKIFQAIFLLKIATIKVTSKREEKKKIAQRPEGLLRASSFKIRFTGSSRGRLRETDPNATDCSSKTRDQKSAAQTYSDPRSAPTSSTNVKKGQLVYAQ